ncbi:malto-oligosyltrehalose synthase [soil metagenome]
MRVPVATYRLQINEDFTLEQARDIVPYLSVLGISDLYLSPIFEARPGSPHGYDITDPTRVRAAIGGEDALRDLAEQTERHGMGILLDIVPNHMAASVLSPWWRDVLENGRRSEYARFFDIDWGTTGTPRRLRLPILGDTLDNVLERGEIDIDVDTCEAVYFDTRLPLSAGSLIRREGLPAGAERSAATRRILDRQHYELAYWRTASDELNYRRFFDITDLAALRVEDDRVFQATHSLTRRLAADGVLAGVRIDHIDGLRDPAGYLRRLRQWIRGPGGEPLYTIVEKILEREERLPGEWACEGTTGYEFLSLATGLLIDPGGYDRLEQFYLRITGDPQQFGELVRSKKLLVMDRLFGSELTALSRSLFALIRLSEEEARRVTAEVTASMSVYRTYTRSRSVREEDRRRVLHAVNDAAERNPDLADGIAALRRVLLLEDAPVSDRTLDWIMRWQQFTGPVMAKGFEDTALYCHNALLAANDVGSDPGRPGVAAPELYSALNLRRSLSPASLNATATHDTKRGEDTRARIAVLSEIADEWRGHLRRWMRKGDEWKAEMADDDDAAVPDADADSLLYQTLVGAWPIAGADDVFTQRIKAYMTKALREAKEQTSWRRPDEDYEQALASFIDALMEEFGRVGLAESIGDFARRVAPHGVLNSLTQALLKITAPGIPDIYQGTELWAFTLVDPDNRQPVDYAERQRLLAELSALIEFPDAPAVRTLLTSWEDGRIKLLFTALALHCRARRADLFSHGAVHSLDVNGTRTDHVIAFARTLDEDACIVVLPRWTTRLMSPGDSLPGPDAWQDTRLTLPRTLQGLWRNTLTGVSMEAGSDIAIADLFGVVPFAVLERPWK